MKGEVLLSGYERLKIAICGQSSGDGHDLDEY